MRFTGRHDDVLMPTSGVVLKIQNGCLRVYHAGPGMNNRTPFVGQGL